MKELDLIWLRTEGVRGGGYSYLLLFFLPFLDISLVDVAKGKEVHRHRDKAPGYNHHRLLIVLRRADKGGSIVIRTYKKLFPRVYYYRADETDHFVTKVEHGLTRMLTIGYLTKAKPKR